jgi:hexosaminidase
VAQASRSGTYWWRLNNTNCNLHDMHDLACPSTHTIPQCQEVCDARADCGGFLYYSKTHSFALKNASCADDVAPLPAYDAGDDLFLLRTFAPPPLPLPPRSASPLSTVEVCVSDASEVLGPHTDESYSIVVNVSATAAAPPPRATVRAKTIFGAMHGLESLAQLVDVRVGHGAEVTIPRAPVTISDAPRFPFRGMMIDSGRHFLPLAHVRRVIDGAALLKLNAIHWHLVDSQSFPSCSVTFPELCEEGAYPNLESAKYEPSSPTRNVSKAKYALADLRDIVLFAKGRGVRIVPEWDVPGHGSWGFGKPELTTSYCKNALDPTNPAVYIFLKAFLLEMTEKAFVDDYLFLGGDELNTDCFDKSPAIAAWMKSHKLNASQTQQYFWQQMTANVFPALAANNKTISVWRADDPNRGPYAANLPPGSVANVYQSLSTAWKQTVPQGVATVVSMAGQKWYLDTMPGGGYYQNAWETVYNLDRGPNGSWLVDPSWGASERALFLGGETAMWGEGVNEDNWEAFVWRGAAAAAERLWATEQSLGCPPQLCPGITGARRGQSYWMASDRSTQFISVGDTRLSDQLCRMSRLGLKPGPIAPGFCPSDVGSGERSSARARRDGSNVDTYKVDGLLVQRLQHENAHLKDENAHLKDENAHLKDENAHLKDENAHLKDENARLQKELHVLRLS